MQKDITGIMVYYYVVCKRKLWYFSNDLTMEHNDENVAIGKSIDENTYNDEDKHINIRDIINIDYIKERNVTHEVKKSRSIEEASIKQVEYYLYYLEKQGVLNVYGILDYPLIKKRKEIYLTDEVRQEIEDILENIKNLLSMDIPPEYKKIGICKKCAYYDICAI